MTWKRGLTVVGVSTTIIAIAFGISFDPLGRLKARMKRNQVTAHTRQFNQRFGSADKLARCTELVASRRWSDLTPDTAFKELHQALGEPQDGDLSCDFSFSRMAWYLGKREGDWTRDPYAAHFFAKYLVLDHGPDQSLRLEIREDYFPNEE